MKKTLIMLLVAFVCLALVACGSDKKEETLAATDGTPAATEGTPAATEETPTATEKNKVEEYIEANREEIETSFAEEFGENATAEVKAENNGVVITIYFNEIEEADDELKSELQAAFDEDVAGFQDIYAGLQEECPEAESLTMTVCAKNGDVLATIKAGK